MNIKYGTIRQTAPQGDWWLSVALDSTGQGSTRGEAIQSLARKVKAREEDIERICRGEW